MVPSVLQTVNIGKKNFKLYVPGPHHIKEAFAEGLLSSPYWSQIWPSSIALSLFILQHPELISGKKVLELGAGLGLPSLIAAGNAAEVLCTDKEKEAVAMVQQSATLHKLNNLQAAVLDWKDALHQDTDIVLLSDVNYEPHSFPALRATIERFLLQGATVILATPQRLMAKDFLTPLMPWCKEQDSYAIPHQQQEVAVTVLVLQSN
jgi:predicted nicotinamide N-methyase